MDIHFTVTDHEAGHQARHEATSLHVGICGSRLELTGLPCGGKLSFEGMLGNITFSVIPAEGQAEAAAEAQSREAIPVPEVSASEALPQADSPIIKEDIPHVESHAAPEDQPIQSLFDCLVALRKQISSEVKVPPYIIFHDSTLREMCRALPGDLQALKAVQGVGEAKLEKYGMRFIEAIRHYAAVHGTGAAHSTEGAA